MNQFYYCYIIYSELNPNRTYTGTTNNLEKRLNKHNGLLVGGAKATRIYTDWKYYKIIKFNNYKSALSFEWYLKHYKTKYGTWNRTKSGLNNKLKRLNELFAKYECVVIL